MGELAIVLAIFSVGHSLAVVIRQNGPFLHTPSAAKMNGINSFWAFTSGLGALILGIVAAVS